MLHCRLLKHSLSVKQKSSSEMQCRFSAENPVSLRKYFGRRSRRSLSYVLVLSVSIEYCIDSLLDLRFSLHITPLGISFCIFAWVLVFRHMPEVQVFYDNV